MDWTLAGILVTTLGSIIVAILQNRGKVAAAAKAQEVGNILSSVIKGVEKASKADPALKGTKAFITAAAMDAGVQEKLAGIVTGLFPKKNP